MDFDMRTLLCLLYLQVVAVCARDNADFWCLKSIKESLEDPENVLTSTWNFDNHTEGAICKFPGVECWHVDESRVLSIYPSDMGLGGLFPRGLANCSSLTGLYLSSNHLSGSLPSDISSLIGNIVHLDLSNNDFSGEIPVDIANCTYLNEINLDSNQLEGRIPPDLGGLNRIKSFSVANNQLSGPVPVFPNEYVTKDNYVNNKGLCGGPLSSCIRDNDHEIEKVKFICGFIEGWVVSALVSLFLGLFYLPDMCSSPGVDL